MSNKRRKLSLESLDEGPLGIVASFLGPLDLQRFETACPTWLEPACAAQWKALDELIPHPSAADTPKERVLRYCAAQTCPLSKEPNLRALQPDHVECFVRISHPTFSWQGFLPMSRDEDGTRLSLDHTQEEILSRWKSMGEALKATDQDYRLHLRPLLQRAMTNLVVTIVAVSSPQEATVVACTTGVVGSTSKPDKPLSVLMKPHCRPSTGRQVPVPVVWVLFELEQTGSLASLVVRS